MHLIAVSIACQKQFCREIIQSVPKSVSVFIKHCTYSTDCVHFYGPLSDKYPTEVPSYLPKVTVQ